VELRSPTVSRQHAVLRYLQGQWHIENLSRTNPVLINGRSLPAGGAARSALADGDRVEMGEVVFRFRWR
jgi:predicted component of type VI protein secretion system